MPLELRLAWRNVWRNPRRSALSIAATVFAVYLVVSFVGMAAGTHEKMIEDSVRLHSGHVAISGAGYRENQTLEHFVALDPELVELLDGLPGVEGWAPRVLSFALLCILNYLDLNILWCGSVVRKLHRELAATRGHRAECSDVAEHFGERSICFDTNTGGCLVL